MQRVAYAPLDTEPANAVSPICVQLYSFQKPPGLADDSAFLSELRSIPGVLVRGNLIRVSSDLVAIVAGLADAWGAPLGTPTIRGGAQRATKDVRLVRGFDKLYPFQQEVAIAGAGQAFPIRYVPPAQWRESLPQRDIRKLWIPCGGGKSALGLAIASAARSQRAPTLIVTKAAGRESYLRDAAWIGDFKQIGLLLGRYPASAEVRKDAESIDRRFIQRFRDAGTNCRVYTDANDAIAEGCDAIVVGWESIAIGTQIVTTDSTGIERKKKQVDLRPDLRRAWSVLLLDEVHFAANKDSMRGDVSDRLNAAASFSLAMTASGVRAGIQDLWAQFALVAPEAWDRKPWKFMLRYLHATSGDYGGLTYPDPKDHFPRRGSTAWPCTVCQKSAAELAARLGHWTEIRTLAVVRSQLPAKRREFHRIPWPEKFKERRAEEGQSAATQYERALEKCAEIATPWAVDRAVELLSSGAKIMIVGQRLQWVGPTILALQAALPKSVREKLWLRGSYEDGSTLSPIKRSAMANEYMQQKGPACVVGTLSALSESLDFQDTDELICVVPPPTVKDVTQLEGRVQRIGQRRPVTISYAIPVGTIAEVIYDRLLGRMQTVEAVKAATDDQLWQAEAPKTDEEVQAGVRAWLAAQSSGQEESGDADD